MDLAYCVQCGGSFIRDEATDTTCGDCFPGEDEAIVLVTKDGGEWGDIANELVWESGNATDIDALEALRMSIEDQLPAEYWEMSDEDEPLGVTLTAEQAQMLDELQTKWAEQGE